MLIYKQRYKSRTTREFTKNDLTVYDSADNTALNALTVYGKSEVVDGAIKSAGEGWATVDLGTLNWIIYNGIFFASITGILPGTSYNAKRAMFCKKYTKPPINPSSWSLLPDKNMLKNDATELFIQDTDYTDVATFKNSLNGVILAYQLADPTQGNTIAVKTDDGSGIDGTMAAFTTGTPLRSIPDTTVRDVMVWYDSSGEVTKKCGEIDLGTPTWTRYRDFSIFYAPISDIYIPTTPADRLFGLLCSQYSISDKVTATTMPNKSMLRADGMVYIRDDDYTDATAFQTAMNGVMLVYELATPTTQNLTPTENASIAGLRTFDPQTHAQNNAQTDMTVDYTIRVPTI